MREDLLALDTDQDLAFARPVPDDDADQQITVVRNGDTPVLLPADPDVVLDACLVGQGGGISRMSPPGSNSASSFPRFGGGTGFEFAESPHATTECKEKKMAEPFNELTPAEAERLAMLMDAASDVIKIASKTLLHGYESHHPANPSITNRMLLSREVTDLCATVEMMDRDFDGTVCQDTASVIERKLRYAHHQFD